MISTNTRDQMPGNLRRFLHEVSPQKQLEDLILTENVKQLCQELVEEQHRADLLRSHGVEPSNKVFLAGPEGNGKASLAEALAESLIVPFYRASPQGVIGSSPNETHHNLEHLVNYVCQRRCVLFFEGLEDCGRLGFVDLLESLPSYVTIIASTDHPYYVRQSLRSRFQLRIYLQKPNVHLLGEWFEGFQKRLGVDLGYTPKALAREVEGLSFNEVEDLGRAVYRRYVLDQPDADMKDIVRHMVTRWQPLRGSR